MTTLQKTIIGATLAAAIGTGIYEAHRASTFQAKVQTLEQQEAPLAGRCTVETPHPQATMNCRMRCVERSR